MFGSYRSLLALIIVGQHLAGINMLLGNYAVFGFYILSGYLMTLIMQRNYGYSASGMIRYGITRLLRVYPTYWAAVLTSIILILLLGEERTTAFHNAIYLPKSLTEILRNLFLVLPHDYLPRLSPPAWALTVEVFFYAVIGLGLSRNRLITCIWLIVSALYHIIGYYMGLSWGQRFFPIYAAALPFASGAMLYHFRDELIRLLKIPIKSIDPYLPLILWCAIIINWQLGDTFHIWRVKGTGFYINILLCSLMVASLIKRPLLPVIPKWLDAKIGDLSYPIYLTHVQMGLIIYTALDVMGLNYGRMDMRILLPALPLVFLFAWFMDMAVSRPVERIREVVKKTFLT
jgi:peptidoglycan/LPS O-acetylase OafA/YrhL